MSETRRSVFQIAAAATVVSSASTLLSLPAAAQSPATDSVVPEDVRALLSDPATATLIRTIPYGSATYFVLELVDQVSGTGEPVVVKKPANGLPTVLEDFIGLPLVPNASAFNDEADVDLSLFALSEFEVAPGRLPAPFDPIASTAANAAQDKKVAFAAKENIGLDSSHAPGTKKGHLACAWAVNRIVSIALKRPILAGPQGLATANLVKVLKSKHVRVPSPVAGAIVISPTVYSPTVNIGHVGIVGEDGSSVFSNSSSKGQWAQNFTLNSWTDYFAKKKGLPVLFFRLDDVYFPTA